MVAPNLTTVNLVTYGSAKDILNNVRQKMTETENLVTMATQMVANKLDVVGLSFMAITMFLGVIRKKDMIFILELLYRLKIKLFHCKN